jgi:hypothetical protein
MSSAMDDMALTRLSNAGLSSSIITAFNMAKGFGLSDQW